MDKGGDKFAKHPSHKRFALGGECVYEWSFSWTNGESAQVERVMLAAGLAWGIVEREKYIQQSLGIMYESLALVGGPSNHHQ